MNSKGNHYILIICLIFGFLFRIATINQSFWVDEFLTINAMRNSFLFFSRFQIFYFMEHLFILLSEKEWIVRLPSLIFGLFSIILTYYCVRKEFDSITANISIILLTINNIHIYYSQDARPYSLFYLFSTATYFALVMFFKKKTHYSLIIYLVMSLLSFNAHLFAVIMIVGNILSVLIYFFLLIVIGKIHIRSIIKRLTPKLLIYYIVIFVLIILFIIISMDTRLIKEKYPETYKFLSSNFLLYIFKGYSNCKISSFYIYLIFAIIGLLFMFKKYFNFTLIILGQIIVTFVMFFINVHRPIFGRYYIYLLPLYLISIAYGMKSISFAVVTLFARSNFFGNIKNAITALVVVLVIMQSTFGLRMALLPSNENFRDTLKIINVVGDSSQPIIFYPHYYEDGIKHYLQQKNELIFIEDVNNKEKIGEITKSSPVAWAIGVLTRKKFDTLLQQVNFKKLTMSGIIGNEIELWVKYPIDNEEKRRRYEISFGEAVVQFMPSKEGFINLGFIYEKYGMLEAQKIMYQKAQEFSK